MCRDSYYHGKAVICPDGPTTLNMQYAALDFHLRLCRGVGERAAAQRARLERVRPQLPPPSGCPRDRTRARAPLQTVPARPGRRVRRPLAICPPAWCKAKGRKGFAPLLDIYFYLFSEAFANPTPPTEGAPQRVTHSQLGGGTCHDSARTGASSLRQIYWGARLPATEAAAAKRRVSIRPGSLPACPVLLRPGAAVTAVPPRANMT